MKTIPLSNCNLSVMVDDEDYEMLSKYKWSMSSVGGYAKTNIKRDGKYTTINLHTLLMGVGYDHKDRNGLNDQRSNLRKATRSQNGANRKLNVNNKYGYKGVSLKHNGLWHAEIRVNGKLLNLGNFTEITEAAQAYDKAAIEHFGEFAGPNFPIPCPI